MGISIGHDSFALLHEQLLDQVRYLIPTGVWTPRDFLSSGSE
jgi:hypothetical protein